MTLKKILIRFLKENNIYGGDTSKRILNYFTNYGDGFAIPFNAFSWSSTVQGYNYWYEKSFGWIFFLLDNPYLFEGLNPDEKKEISEEKLITILTRLVKYYGSITEGENYKMEMYRKAKKIVENNSRTY